MGGGTVPKNTSPTMSNPHFIGVYRSSFPYPPYPLQVHAVDALRAFLADEPMEEEDCIEKEETMLLPPLLSSSLSSSPSQTTTHTGGRSSGVSPKKEEIPLHQKEKNTSVVPSSTFGSPPIVTEVHTLPSPPLRLAILESPTGTGKSHMLCSAVFSHLFTIPTLEMAFPFTKEEKRVSCQGFPLSPPASTSLRSSGNKEPTPWKRETLAVEESSKAYAQERRKTNSGEVANPLAPSFSSPRITIQEALARIKEKQTISLAVRSSSPERVRARGDAAFSSLISREEDRKDAREVIRGVLRESRRQRRKKEKRIRKELDFLMKIAAGKVGAGLSSATYSAASLGPEGKGKIGGSKGDGRGEEWDERKEEQSFLLDQDTGALLQQLRRYKQGKPSSTSCGMEEERMFGEGRGSASLSPSCASFDALTHFSDDDSSTSSSSRSSEGRKGNLDDVGKKRGRNEEEEEEEDTHRVTHWMELAKEVPLRRPKVYLAARTHTQLEQMRNDMTQTIFAQHPVQYRCPGVSRSSPSPYFLSVLHIASRAQLCINERLKARVGASSGHATSASHVGGGKPASAASSSTSGSPLSLLNEACAEAIQYESSPEGRKERRRRNAQHGPGGTLVMEWNPLAVHASHPAGGELIGHGRRNSTIPTPTERRRGTLPADAFFSQATTANPVMDIEALAVLRCGLPGMGTISTPSSEMDEKRRGEEAGEGCPYAIPSRLQAFLRYLKAQGWAGDTVRTSREHASGTHTPASPASTPAALAPSLEDLLAMGKAMGACPFLVSRLLLRGADVVLLPYTYLLDEDQRQQLLGGLSTNPINEEEEEVLEMDLAIASRSFSPASMPHGTSLSSYPHVEGKRRLATITGDVPSLPTPPDYRGDIVVMDEAHHLTDQCLQSSAAEVTFSTLQFVGGVLQYYVLRYQQRLLTQNKQRLREIILWASRIRRYLETHVMASSSWKNHVTSPSTPEETGEGVEEWECSFHDFVFDAGLDHMDVHVLLQFIDTSRLRYKLRGLTRMLVEQRNKEVLSAKWETSKGVQKKSTASRQAKNLPISTSPLENVEQDKRGLTPAAPCAEGSSSTSFSRNLESIGSLEEARAFLLSTLDEMLMGPNGEPQRKEVDHEEVVEQALACFPHPSWPPSRQRPSVSSHSSFPRVEDGGPWRSADASVVRDPATAQRMATSALEQFYAFLKWFRYSDSDTKVLVSRTVRSYAFLTQKTAQATGLARIRLLQLEPGKHTFLPLVQQAGHTIIAGGTMRPLPLTLYPLIPSVYRYCALPHPPKTHSTLPVGNPTPGVQPTSSCSVAVGRGGWHLITEPHIVPPSSLQVWALGVGPSGQPWCFSHQALHSVSENVSAPLSLPSSSSSQTMLTYTATERRVLADLAAALLNFARVLPPEGMICFVPSYRFQYRLLRFLRDASPHDPTSSPLASVDANSARDVEEGSAVPQPACASFSPSALPPPESYEQCIEKVKKIFSEVILEEDAPCCEEGPSSSSRGQRSEQDSHTTRRPLEHRTGAFSSSSSLGRPKPFREHVDGSIPKRSADLLLREYKEWVEHPLSPSTNTASSPTANTTPSSSSTTAFRRTRGALLVAVIGGKLSEGLNFVDHLGRAVVIVGLPYANPKEKSTRCFLSHIAASSGSSPAGSASSSASLFRLYTDLCMRQVNQSIGRCIRHKDDYAVAILLDVRYVPDRTQRNPCLLESGLSNWMHPSIRVARYFGECFRGVREFFSSRKLNVKADTTPNFCKS